MSKVREHRKKIKTPSQPPKWQYRSVFEDMHSSSSGNILLSPQGTIVDMDPRTERDQGK